MADSFPLYLPFDARRLFQGESLLRRLAQTAHWSKASRLLELHGSLGGLALTKALGCTAVVVEPDPRVSDSLKERARVAAMGERATFLSQAVEGSSFAVESFDGVLSMGRLIGQPGEVARRCRTWLAPKGRLAFTVLVKVSRAPSAEVLAAWEKRLGAPVPSSRDALMAVERAGFEPEFMESVGEAEMDEYYKELDQAAARHADDPGAPALREESRLHRAQNGRAGVTWALIVARRREPGEKPPVNRDGG